MGAGNNTGLIMGNGVGLESAKEKVAQIQRKMGAHINIGRGSRDYIFPLCSTCNVGITGEMKPKANSLAVLALKRDIVD